MLSTILRLLTLSVTITNGWVVVSKKINSCLFLNGNVVRIRGSCRQSLQPSLLLETKRDNNVIVHKNRSDNNKSDSSLLLLVDNQNNNNTGKKGEKLLYDDDTTNNIGIAAAPVVTNALIQISYDGRRFTGWSAANDNWEEKNNNNVEDKKSTSSSKITTSRTDIPQPPQADLDRIQQPKKQRKRKKNKNQQNQYQNEHNKAPGSGFVRSVEGVIMKHLAKLYGNIHPNRIVVEGCSRTDKGVHARCMMALIYALKDPLTIQEEEEEVIPGKRKPHPRNSTDTTHFLPLPMNLNKLVYCFNRMLPNDVRIAGISPTPTILTEISTTTTTQQSTTVIIPFHPTLSAISKTYKYTFSIGQGKDALVYDPTSWRTVWNMALPLGSSKPFDIDQVQRACQILQGTHDFESFQAMPRSKTDREKLATQSTVCTLHDIHMDIIRSNQHQQDYHTNNCFSSTTTYTVTVTGDRFLYKMVRNIVGALVAVGTGKLNVHDIETATEICTGREQNTHNCKEEDSMNNNNEEYKKYHNTLATKHTDPVRHHDTTTYSQRKKYNKQDCEKKQKSTRNVQLCYTCAPAHGLVLYNVSYPSMVDIDWQSIYN